MEDRDIIELFHARTESAIDQTADKYGHYCQSIAFRILQNEEDAKECVNDTYLRAWNSIPPHDPPCLRLFLGRITRNLAFDLFKKRSAEKRGAAATLLPYEELGECLPSAECAETVIDRLFLGDILTRFLKDLSPTEQWVFVHRYWDLESIEEIAAAVGITPNYAKVMLHRLRKKLSRVLEKEGITP